MAHGPATEAQLKSEGDGVVVFSDLPSRYPGHVDLYDLTKNSRTHIQTRWTVTSGECGSDCYFGSRMIWFWPAK